ncbi:hypothetical protein Syun_000824 [Stephania yunnanensis]|uniref:Uncharacterized protein n=1 Tax=Stephania yunnanensis TaxID=152371 RepID=A0AAP0Q752_9MAGN
MTREMQDDQGDEQIGDARTREEEDEGRGRPATTTTKWRRDDDDEVEVVSRKRQLRYTEDKGRTQLPAIHGGLLKPDVVEGTDDERVWSLHCWDLTETSKRDDGIDLLKDNQALQRLTGTAEKAKMDLSSMTQTNIRMVEVICTPKELLEGVQAME